MNTKTRRFVFISYDNLLKVKFKKLEKVCEKAFVFINTNVGNVPFELVQQTQRLGQNLKWIIVDQVDNYDINYHIAFVMGKLHQKVGKDIEFAILSNDENFDSLINYINDAGRNCLRVRRKSMAKEETNKMPTSGHDEIPFMNKEEMKAARPAKSEIKPEKDVVQQTARETIRRLIRSGNRPSEISMLKDYILLHNHELSVHTNIDQVIRHLEDTKDIEIREEEIIYNF